MTAHYLKAAAVAAAAGAILAASSGVADAAASHSRPSVAVHSSTRYPVTAPDVMRPGLVHLRNTGSHPLYLFQKTRFGAPRLLTDLNASAKSVSPGRLIRDFTLLDIIDGRSDIYVRMPRGTYFLVDATAMHYRLSDVHAVAVKGKFANAALPASHRLHIDSHNALSAPKTLPRNGYLHIRNDSSHLQDVLFIRVANSTPTDVLNDFVAHPDFEKLVALQIADFEEAGTVAARHGVYVHFRPHAGRYIVMTVPTTAKLVVPDLSPARVRLVTVH